MQEGKTNIQLINRNAEDLNGIADNSFDAIMSNLVLHLVSDPSKMTSEAHRVLKPGAIAYFSVLSDFENSSVFSGIPNLMKKYGYVRPNTRSIFHISEDSALKSLFPEDKFKVLMIDQIYLKMEKNPKIVSWNSLDVYAEFVHTLEPEKREKLIKEHNEMTQALNSGEKPLDFNIKAIFVKKK